MVRDHLVTLSIATMACHPEEHPKSSRLREAAKLGCDEGSRSQAGSKGTSSSHPLLHTCRIQRITFLSAGLRARSSPALHRDLPRTLAINRAGASVVAAHLRPTEDAVALGRSSG
jgi:hypothetical protein